MSLKYIYPLFFLVLFSIPCVSGAMSANLDIATLNDTYVPFNGSAFPTDLNNKNLTNVNIFQAIAGWFTNLFYNDVDINVTGHIGRVCQEDYIWKADASGIMECRPDKNTDNQNLQEVTNEGATTDNKITIGTDDTDFLTPTLFLNNNNTYGSAYTRYENDNGSQLDIGAYGLGISQVAFPRQLQPGESAMGISSRDGDIWIATRDNDSILFGGTPDDNLSNANFSVAIRPDLQAIQIQGNKFIIPKKSDGGFTMWEYSEDQQVAGGVPFCKASLDGNGNLAVLDCLQVGRNNSGSVRMNSQIAIPKDYIQYVLNASGYALNQSLLDVDMTEFVFNLTDYVQYCDYRENIIGDLPEGCKFYADTSGQGLVTSTDNLEAMGETVLHDGTVMYESLDFIGRNGKDANFLFNGYNGGKIHARETALVQGEFAIFYFTLADFDDGTLGAFKEVSPPASNPLRVWRSVDHVNCWSDRCGEARGGELKTMEYSESTTFVGGTVNVSEINLSFYLTTEGLDGGESFYVEADDNQGNVSTIYTQTSNQVDVFVELTLPDVFENKANVTTRFIHDANLQQERSWVDEVKIVAVPLEPVLTNESYYAGQITLGQDTNSLTECYIRMEKQYNDTTHDTSEVMVLRCPNIDIQGNLTETSITVVSQNVTGDVEAQSFTLNGTTIEDWTQAGNETYLVLDGSNANTNIDITDYNISANTFHGQLDTRDENDNGIYTENFQWGQSGYTFPILKGSAVNGTNNVFFVERGFFIVDQGQGTQFYLTSNDSLKNVQFYYNPTSDSFSLTAGQQAAGVTDFNINMPLVSDKQALFKDGGTFLDTTINDGGNRFKIGYDLSPAPIGADLFRIYHGGIGNTEVRIETLPDTSYVLGTPELVLASATGEIILEDNTTIEGNLTADTSFANIDTRDEFGNGWVTSTYEMNGYNFSYLQGQSADGASNIGMIDRGMYFMGNTSTTPTWLYFTIPEYEKSQYIHYDPVTEVLTFDSYAGTSQSVNIKPDTLFTGDVSIGDSLASRSLLFTSPISDIGKVSGAFNTAFRIESLGTKNLDLASASGTIIMEDDTEVQGNLNVTGNAIANTFNGELNTSSNDVGWVTSTIEWVGNTYPLLSATSDSLPLGFLNSGLYLVGNPSVSNPPLFFASADGTKNGAIVWATDGTQVMSFGATAGSTATFDFDGPIETTGVTSTSGYSTSVINAPAYEIDHPLGHDFWIQSDFPAGNAIIATTDTDIIITPGSGDLIINADAEVQGNLNVTGNATVNENLNVTESVTADKLKVDANNYFTADGSDAVKMILGGFSGEYFTVDAINGLDFYDGGGSMKFVPMGTSGGMEISTEIGKMTFLTSDIYSTANVHFTGTGTNTIGDTGSTNYFGASGSTTNYFGASGSNDYGAGATHNNFGEFSTLNHIGENAELNTFGDDADENRFGSTSGVNKWYGDLDMQSYDLNTTGTIKAGEYESSDGSAGITNTTGYWICDSSDCSTTCQVQIKDGLITGCT